MSTFPVNLAFKLNSVNLKLIIAFIFTYINLISTIEYNFILFIPLN